MEGKGWGRWRGMEGGGGEWREGEGVDIYPYYINKSKNITRPTYNYNYK